MRKQYSTSMQPATNIYTIHYRIVHFLLKHLASSETSCNMTAQQIHCITPYVAGAYSSHQNLTSANNVQYNTIQYSFTAVADRLLQK